MPFTQQRSTRTPSSTHQGQQHRIGPLQLLVRQPQFWHMHVAVSTRLRGCPIPPHGNPPATLERAPLRAPRGNDSLADAHGFAGWTTKLLFQPMADPLLDKSKDQ